MPGEKDEATGGYRQTGTAADGLYANQHQAELAEGDALYGKSGGSGGGGGGAAMAGPMGLLIKAFMWIVIFGPIVLAKIYGWLFGILSNAGKGGRVAQAFVFQFLPIGLMTMAGSFSAIKNLIGDFGITSIIGVVIAGVLNLLCLAMAFWFYHTYYFTVRAMGVSVFSAMIKKVAMIIWFCCLGGGILTMINPVVGGVVIAGGFVAAIIYFIKLSKQHSTNAKDLKKSEPASPTSTFVLMIIVVAINAAIPAVLGLPAGIKYAVTMGERKAAQKAEDRIIAEVVDAAKKASAGNVYVTVLRNYNSVRSEGTNMQTGEAYVIEIGTPIYSKPSLDRDISQQLKNVVVGDRLRVTGEAVKDGDMIFIPVERDGVNGFMYLNMHGSAYLGL